MSRGRAPTSCFVRLEGRRWGAKHSLHVASWVQWSRAPTPVARDSVGDLAYPLSSVGDVYDCAIEPERWPPTLKRIADYAGGDHAGITVHEPLKREMRWGVAWGLDPDAQRRYDEQYHAINPLLTAGWFMEVDEPYTSQSFLGENFFASRFFKEWVAPSGYHDAALTILAKGSNRFAAITLPRLADRGQFAAADLARMRLLAPHVRRSVTITDLLDARALRDDMLSATLDLLVVGIVLVDGEARIVHANRAGARHLDEAQAVRRSDDRLSARHLAAAAALKDAVTRATQPGAAVELAKTGTSGQPDLMRLAMSALAPASR